MHACAWWELGKTMMTSGKDADLKTQALAVTSPQAPQSLSARTAARCLLGVASLIARTWDNEVMRRTFADLVRYDAAWESNFGRLPSVNGHVSEPMRMLATVARGFLPLAGVENMRAALSFWATEDDPRIWQSVTDA
jgi:hypothetical protein